MPKFWKVGSAVVLVAGLTVGVALVQQKQNIFGKAWSSFTANLPSLSSLGPPPPPSYLPQSTKSQILFYRLGALYPNAEKQDIDIPSADVRGQAYLARDTSRPILKTFIFVRLENLAAPTGRVLQLWLANSQAQIYSRAATFETVSGSSIPTSYAVTVRESDLSEYDTVSVSFDLAPDVSSPSLPIIDLRL